MKIRSIDYSLYLVTDRDLSRGRSTLEIVEAAVRGGATCVQLREKDCSTRAFIEEALSVKDFLKKSGIPLIINDRVDVAQAVEADGVHLGQNDMPLDTAKQILGGADYLGVSPIYATPTKTDTAPALGVEGLQAMRKAVRIPLVGIGGLKKENSMDVIRGGADGVAVVSAIVSTDDPELAARELLQVITRARKT